MSGAGDGRRGRKLSFLCIGGSAYLLGIAVIEMLKAVGISVFLAQVPAFLIGATYTWWLNRRFTYDVDGPPSIAEYGRYLASSAAGLSISMAAFSLLVLAGAPAFAALAAGTLCGLFFNYWSYGRFAFRR